MKIKEVIAESFYDFYTKGIAAGKQRDALSGARTATYKQGIVPDATPAPEPEPIKPETDISKTVPAGMQFRFKNPENPGSSIIIRQTGYYVDSLPKNLQGQVKRDKATGLYPVLRATNIQKYNEYYNQAADARAVIEEPVHAL